MSSWFKGDFDDDGKDDSRLDITESTDSTTKDEISISKRRKYDGDIVLWIDRYRPKRSDELAVTRKKIDDVRTWIVNNLFKKVDVPRRRRILILSGPSGSGKTAVVRVLAKELRFQIREWENPSSMTTTTTTTTEGDVTSYPASQISRFSHFLRRAGKYKSVLDPIDQSVVVIEDFPSVKSHDFRSVISNFGGKYFPLIFIVQSESLKAAELFSPEFLESIEAEKINLNPVTTANTTKVMKDILSRVDQTIRIPDIETLTSIAESSKGDIRSAINALQFSCLHGTSSSSRRRSYYNNFASTTTRSKRKSNTSSSKSIIGSKDTSLDMFHAIGKVLYAKREDRYDEYENPTSFNGRKTLKTDPNDILDKCPLSPDTFSCFLQQNFVPFFKDVETLSRAADFLSLADPFYTTWSSTGKFDLSEYGGLLSIRGLLFYNSDPIRQIGSLRTFHKPELYGIDRIVRTRNEELRTIFRTRSLPLEDIAIEFVPILVKIVPCSTTVRQIGFFSDTSSKVVDTRHVCNGGDPIIRKEEGNDDDEEEEEFTIEEF